MKKLLIACIMIALLVLMSTATLATYYNYNNNGKYQNNYGSHSYFRTSSNVIYPTYRIYSNHYTSTATFKDYSGPSRSTSSSNSRIAWVFNLI